MCGVGFLWFVFGFGFVFPEDPWSHSFNNCDFAGSELMGEFMDY